MESIWVLVYNLTDPWCSINMAKTKFLIYGVGFEGQGPITLCRLMQWCRWFQCWSFLSCTLKPCYNAIQKTLILIKQSFFFKSRIFLSLNLFALGQVYRLMSLGNSQMGYIVADRRITLNILIVVCLKTCVSATSLLNDLIVSMKTLSTNKQTNKSNSENNDCSNIKKKSA